MQSPRDWGAETRVLTVTEPSQVGEVRRAAATLARALDLDETVEGQAAVVATEAANNLVRHGGGGEVLLRALEEDQGGVEMLALDRGPGMADVAASLADGYSTGGTAGTGLGAMARLSREFDVYSRPGQGTVVLAQVGPARPASKAPWRTGAISVPVAGEEVCGDSWGVRAGADWLLAVVADGLGHGWQAAEASRAAMGVLDEAGQASPAELLERIHRALRGSRGAAVAVAAIDLAAGRVRFAGAGNIAARVEVPGATQHLVSHHGTAGLEVRRIQEFTYGWARGARLVLLSDGLATNWTLRSYDRLVLNHPAVLAGVLFRDLRRGRDDACVLAIGEGA